MSPEKPHLVVIGAIRHFQNAARDAFLVTLGSCIVPFLIGFLIATIPALVLRTLINLAILPLFLRRRYGYHTMVSTGFATPYATEYISCVNNKRPSRNVILQSNFVQGHLTFDNCRERIEKGLVEATRVDKNGCVQVKLPELSSYVENWMGYFFWKKDDHFDIRNHVHHHQLPDSTNLDNFCDDLYEKLMNQLFIAKRSPWEFHIVHGQKNGKSMTVLIVKIHHVCGDGLSVMLVGLEGLFGIRFEDYYDVPLLSNEAPMKQNHRGIPSLAVSSVKLVLRLLHDLGSTGSFLLWRANVNTPFHIPDNKKSWKQLYERSGHLSMEKIKFIKNKLGVSFSAVVMSCVAHGIAETWKSKLGEQEDENGLENFLCASPKLLPWHATDRLTTEITGTAYNIPVKFETKSLQRLRRCDQVIREVNPSLFNRLFPFLTTALSFHVSPIANFGFKNSTFPISISNNAGPTREICIGNESKVVEMAAAVGGFQGIAGLMLLVFSYKDSFCLNVVAENAVMSKTELRKFVESFENELNALYNSSSG